jgi:hypothetical protein
VLTEGTCPILSHFVSLKYICLYAPKDTVLIFAVNKFECCAAFIKDKKTADQIKISICIDTIVNSKAKVNIIVPIADSSLSIINKACISADRIFDSVSFCSETCLLCKKMLLKAQIYNITPYPTGKREFIQIRMS